jgi:hypothetical protein
MTPRLGQAAILGGGVAALIGSVYLIASAVEGRRGWVDCTGLHPVDCQVVRETRAQLARTQTLSAIALALLALAAFLFLRSRRRAS